ncbi:hypothetical protein B566_EDAN016608 [Ephemera danica]|nr:hypothetical protein B566_EDAN016608 [Ephemera danica]
MTLVIENTFIPDLRSTINAIPHQLANYIYKSLLYSITSLWA